jgi:hypothetical protein
MSGGVDDHKLAACAPCTAGRIHQHAQAATIDEVDPGEVDLDRQPPTSSTRQRFAKSAHRSQVELALDEQPYDPRLGGCVCVDMDHQPSRPPLLTGPASSLYDARIGNPTSDSLDRARPKSSPNPQNPQKRGSLADRAHEPTAQAGHLLETGPTSV